MKIKKDEGISFFFSFLIYRIIGLDKSDSMNKIEKHD